MHEKYFVNASRGLLDFMFPEYDTFSELEYGVMMLTAMGYEITVITLIQEKE